MKKIILSLILLFLGFSSVKAQENILQESGNVGIGTINPTEKLVVRGKVSIDSMLVVKDSILVNKDIRVKKNFKVEKDVRFTAIDTVTNLNNKSILLIQPNGKLVKVSQDELAQSFGDLFYEPKGCTDEYKADPTWMNGLKKIYTRCPEVFVGINTNTPRVNLDVEGTIYGKQLSFGSIDPSAISDNLFTGKAYNNNPNKNIFNILGSNNDVLFRMNNRGNMGLATENPRVKLDVLGTSYSEKIAFGAINPNQIENYTFVGKATNGLPTQNAFTILGADNSSFLNVVNTGKVSVGTSTSTDVKFSVNFNAGVSSNKAFVSNYTAAGDYSYANILNVDRDLTKALAIFNTTTNKENIVLFGDGTVNLKRLQIESLNDLQKTIAMKRAADGRETFVVYGNGDLWATGVHVRGMGNFPDYVFDKSYQLMPLNDLKKYIDEKKHLPNMPSAENIEKEGADLAELNRILVEKVEELTLYIIEQNTKIEALEEQKAIIAELIKEINILKSKF
jgi:hypothetical protein